MALKPWYKEVEPRDDLKEGKPLDASEFAVHLDHVRTGRALADYTNPQRFFDRTVLTENLCSLGAEVVRRLSGIKVETSAVFNLTTQFGGGKTHALTMLFHLANHGAKASDWREVSRILSSAGVTAAPKAEVAVFVGTEFDSTTGRGGDDGTPRRFTPWGELAWQLGKAEGFAVVAAHDEQRKAPSTEVIRKFLPKKPVLILMDEMLNYMNRERKSGLTGQLHAFLQNLSEEARAQDRVVLVVSLPSVLDEMTPDDEADFDRFEKLLNRLGKSMMMSAGSETTEIIRRRLFDWGGHTKDARATAKAYAEWVQLYRSQLVGPIDGAAEAFLAAYPFHPAVISVFERKWQQLQRFQQTRGILRLLALWVSHAYQEAVRGRCKEPLIGLGSAPLDDSFFRQAVFDQLGGAKLEGAITADICGRKDSHAERLDVEATEAIKKSRLHRKVATTIFFESNGGQTQVEAAEGEIRFAVGEPGMDIGNIETVIDGLTASCYYLSQKSRRYRFSLSPNLNMLLSAKRAGVADKDITETVRAKVQSVFAGGSGVERVLFPDKSSSIPDRAALTLVVLAPEHTAGDKSTLEVIENFTREHGGSNRTFKSALFWAVADKTEPLHEEARKVLAWQSIFGERDGLRLDDEQKTQLKKSLEDAERDLTEAVWRTYKHVFLLDKNGGFKLTDLGLPHSSQESSMVALILRNLKTDGDIEEVVAPDYLVRNWPNAFVEWGTKSLRDAFFASPQLVRLTKADSLKDTIARGVHEGKLAYVGKKPGGGYDPFYFEDGGFNAASVEFTDDMFVIKGEVAKEYKKALERPQPPVSVTPPPGPGAVGPETPAPGTPEPVAPSRFSWGGNIPPAKWMNFYMKVLTRFANDPTLRLTLKVEVAPTGAGAEQKVQEAEAAIKDLGLED
jgi:hypothetical protein